MGIRDVTFLNSRLRFFKKESFDRILFRNMALFTSFCWSNLAMFFFFLIRLIAQHVFRIKVGNNFSQKAIEGYSEPLEPVSEDNEIEERLFRVFSEEEKEEPSNFSFKFEYQIPKISAESNEQLSEPTMKENYRTRTVDISKYRFSSERDCCGFFEESKVATLQVHESFIDASQGNLESKFLPARDFEKPVIRDNRSLPENDFTGFVEESKSMNFQVNESFVDRIEAITESDFLAAKVFEKPTINNFQFMPDKDFSRFLEKLDFRVCESSINTSEEKLDFGQPVLVKDDKVQGKEPTGFASNSFRGKEAMESFSGFGSESNSISLSDGDSEKNFVIDSESDGFETNSLGGKPISFETNSFGGKEAMEGFSGFDSDSDSISLSDGYSVKNFAKDSESDGFETNSLGGKPIGFGVYSLGGKFTGFDSDSDSISLSDSYSLKNLVIDSESDGFLSERDFVGDNNCLIDPTTVKAELMENLEKLEGQSSDLSNRFSDVLNQTDCGDIYDGFLSERVLNGMKKTSEEKLDEFQSFVAENYSPYIDGPGQLNEIWSETESLELELEELNEGEIEGAKLQTSRNVETEFIDSSDDEIPYARNTSNDFDVISDSSAECNDSNGDHLNSIDSSNHFDKALEAEEKCEVTKSKDLDAEDVDELESLWEHQDLIEQLKMELKRARNVGLPTIFEESESPKTIEDLKPWKIHEKFLREDPIDELHKLYKSYRERMRKLDILNYQKMYAIGFLKLKNPLESMRANKPLISTIISHLSQNLRGKSGTNPPEKFMKELQVDLEAVYVGQTCLSWEFLRWQYEKAQELSDPDPYRSPQYNQVAGEFQQFQVTLQRFIENEPFQGPRLQNYVQNRCVLRNLLQVPLMKEDCLKDKMVERRKGNYVITGKMLEKIMKDSIGIFWEFVKAEKDENSIILKGLIRNQVELQDPSDSKVMTNIQASLQKKEKKLKDIMKTGNCLVKKFKKPRGEERTNQELFFSQIDMKLVSRVLKMSRITSDQLVWCHEKLSKIRVADRKIHREPSFLPFPC